SSDNRWLWSVDGRAKITPIGSSEFFRYLGVWLSMDLNWSKQIQILEKVIKDWRWKAFRAQIDVAQLRAAFTEYLWPKLESVLLYATIPKKVYLSWMSIVIETFGKRGGMNTVHTLNRCAFCVLADIPHIWLRAQTARTTELIVYLNSYNSI